MSSSKELHQWLREAFEKRQISDYDFMTGIGESDALELQKKAENFLLKTEQFLQQEGII